MTLRPNLFQHLLLLLLLVILAAFTIFLGLLWLAPPAQAAPPWQPLPPQPLPNPGALTITPTKISNPVGLIQAGQTLTFTIAFKSNIAGTIIITDAVPDFTSYKAGSISSLVATTTNVVTADASNPAEMAWTVTNNVTNTLINLSFAVVVSSLAPTGTQIVNAAWLSDSNDITTTTPITVSVANSIQTVFLPIIMNGLSFSGDTRLLVHSINTGGVSVVEVRSIPDNTLVLLCGMSDNTTGFCGTLPAGQYTVIATTLNCGQIKTVETITGEEHTVTAECFTGPPPPVTTTTQVFIETNNTGGNVAIEIRTQDASQTLKLACNVPDGAVTPCGSITSGTYRVIGNTLNCGQIVAPSLLITGTQRTIPVFCNSIQGVWSGWIDEYFAE